MMPGKRPPGRRSTGDRPRSFDPGSAERIQKVLAQAGLGSRRQVESWISDGKIRVNGRTAGLGDRIAPTDRLEINGRPVDLQRRLAQPIRVLAYHKPVGELVTRRDPRGRDVIFTQLPKLQSGRWIAVGRLDINTQGLLLVTNNGELANRLMHPASALEREYLVRILGRPSAEVLKRLCEGVELDDGPARFEALAERPSEGANRWFSVMVRQGRNRMVRRLWEAEGFSVNRLIRIRYGDIVLPERLKPRVFHEFDEKEKTALLKSVDMPVTDSRRRSHHHTKNSSTTRRKKR